MNVDQGAVGAELQSLMAPALRSPNETGEEGSLLSQFLLTAFDEVLLQSRVQNWLNPE
jgi:hypothetical protein